ncbi:MAG TPA: hypothetical protein PKE49_01620 [Leptospiraceae bacterium]|nr:hypothetical protein [Leptospirales bacterium]HMU82493.1 hypothetical protein [Leptospiraceae bacterium]HMW59441.1 hypothetical protein [Leptospiraceae bacterium]HMX55187.1 hypothetical protein [Leptospiraceae bacterium]HMZ36289.1 hypothetical protein [Leptospiraceae bacterium]
MRIKHSFFYYRAIFQFSLREEVSIFFEIVRPTFRPLFLSLIFALTQALHAAPDKDAKKDDSGFYTFGLQLMFWTGLNRDFYSSDLETRFFRDDILRGQNTAQPVAAAQYNNKWVSKPQFNLPVRGTFSPGFLPQLNLEGAYYRERGNITYYGLSDLPAPDRTHIVELSGFDRSTTTFGAAYNFLGYFRVDPMSLLALRGGYIRESTDFNFKPLSFATSGVIVSLFDNPFHAVASGWYGGIELTLPIWQKWSATLKVDRSEALHGNMQYEKIQLQPASGGIQATYDRAESRYRLARTDRMAAVNYHITSDFKVTVGYREVIYDVSYPGFFSYSLTNAGGAVQVFPVTEFILDYFNYQETRRERIGNAMFAFEKIFVF